MEPENIAEVNDIRLCKPHIFRNKKDGNIIITQETYSFTINGHLISFFRPNNVSICLYISKNELNKAKKIHSKLVQPKLTKTKISFTRNQMVKLLDYFEALHKSIIFIYIAVEAFVNVSIPYDYVFEKENNKKIKETWNKDNIERWMSTSEKIKMLIPNILSTPPVGSLPFWNNFIQLENIRNDIVHQKASTDIQLYEKMLNDDIFEIIDSGFALLYFFSQYDQENQYFPLGFGDSYSKVVEVEDFNAFFQHCK
jgi:hypothetical protein